MNVAEGIFWACVLIIFYTFVGYPMVVWLLSKLKSVFTTVPSYSSDYAPEITLVVPCFNEGTVLERKVKNCFDLDYPKNKIKFLFITDGSDDGSNHYLAGIEGIQLMHEDIRAGKSVAENRAMNVVDTPIVVFSDANTLLNREAIREIVKHYQDDRVGGVAGEKRIISSDLDSAPAAGEGFYWKYESYLKKLDSELHSVVGGAGELISFRSALYTPLEEDTILDDFIQSMRIALSGYRVVYEPNAYAEETASATVREEQKRKVRISAGAWQAMSRLGKAFNPFHHPIITFLFVSHKVFRWTFAPLALLMLIPANIYLHLEVGNAYSMILYLQLCFYAFTLLGWFLEHRKVHVKLVFIPYYFFMTNWSMYLGFAKFITGGQSAKWERVRRA